MKILINGVKVESFKFPAGEVNIRLPSGISPPFKVTAFLQSSDSIMGLLLVDNALKCHFDQRIKELIIPYLPYARQDRVCNHGEAISRDVFITLISKLFDSKFNKTYDVHSAGLPAGWTQVYLDEILEDAPFLKNPDIIIAAPDKGASEKCKELSDAKGCPIIMCCKTRNPTTGKLAGFGIESYSENPAGKDIWIVDDICDGGGTFLGLHEKLKEFNPRSINLFVTHGVFSKGLEELCSVFDQVVTTDTFDSGLEHPLPSNFAIYKIL
jgi:ribose-phosphate pyrophosphokinase